VVYHREMVCAGCGVPILPGKTKGWWRDLNGSLACVVEIDTSDKEKPVLLWADYHYVEGEVQRYWPKRTS